MTAAPPLPAKLQRLLDWLTEVAAIGESCPMNGAIRCRLGYSQDSSAAGAVGRLEELGHIQVERFQHDRVVTIVSTGRSTKRPPASRQIPHVRPEPSIKRATAKGNPTDRLLAVSRQVRPASSTSTPSVAAIVERISAAGHPPAAAPTTTAFPVGASVVAAPPPSIPPQTQLPTVEETPMPAIQPTPADTAKSVVSGVPGLKADVEFRDGEILLTVWLSADPGPARQFRPFLTVPLDEMHATELLGSAAIALRDARQAAA